jgi:hypothetical protein
MEHFMPLNIDLSVFKPKAPFICISNALLSGGEGNFSAQESIIQYSHC